MSTVTPGFGGLRSLLLMGLMLGAWPGSGWAGLAPAAAAGVAERYGKLPLSFEANQGQTDARVKFLARGPGYAVFLTADEAVLTLRPAENPPASINPFFNPLPPGEGRVRGSQQDFFLEDIFAHTVQAAADLQSRVVPPHPNPLPEGEGAKALDRLLRGEAGNMAEAQGAVVRMRLEGARTGVPVTGRARLPGTVNYLKGRNPAGWRTGVATYGRVEYRGVYPGIDLVYYGHQRQLEYDFVVAPGADPNQIRLSFAGADPAAAPRLEANGDLLLPTGAGAVRLRKPVAYQEIDGRRRVVEGRFVMRPPA